jgi:hypothetical protein
MVAAYLPWSWILLWFIGVVLHHLAVLNSDDHLFDVASLLIQMIDLEKQDWNCDQMVNQLTVEPQRHGWRVALGPEHELAGVEWFGVRRIGHDSLILLVSFPGQDLDVSDFVPTGQSDCRPLGHGSPVERPDLV